MTFCFHHPPPPALPLERCTDPERKINGRCWDLKGVQRALLTGSLSLIPTAKAEAEMRQRMSWGPEDLLAFFKCLGSHRYNDSEWVLAPAARGERQSLKADSYVMGFNRLKGIENQRVEPWVYFKYTVREEASVVLVLSAHPENVS